MSFNTYFDMLKVKGTNFLKVRWNNLFWQKRDERFHALFEQLFLCREIIGDLIFSVLEKTSCHSCGKKNCGIAIYKSGAKML